jgi:alkylhydroperoxidase family enzyme
MPSQPRLTPLPEPEWDEHQRAVVEPLLFGPTRSVPNVHTMLVRAPELAEGMTTFGRIVRSGGISARHRETLILRTGWNCGSEYEFAEHRQLAFAIGMSEEDVRRIQDGPDAEGWDRFERTLCILADELHATSEVTDATWAELSDDYSEQELIQAMMLVGYYHLVAYMLNGLRVPIEEGKAGFDSSR